MEGCVIIIVLQVNVMAESNEPVGGKLCLILACKMKWRVSVEVLFFDVEGMLVLQKCDQVVIVLDH